MTVVEQNKRSKHGFQHGVASAKSKRTKTPSFCRANFVLVFYVLWD